MNLDDRNDPPHTPTARCPRCKSVTWTGLSHDCPADWARPVLANPTTGEMGRVLSQAMAERMRSAR